MKNNYNYMFLNDLVSFKFIKNEMHDYKCSCLYEYCASKQSMNMIKDD